MYMVPRVPGREALISCSAAGRLAWRTIAKTRSSKDISLQKMIIMGQKRSAWSRRARRGRYLARRMWSEWRWIWISTVFPRNLKWSVSGRIAAPHWSIWRAEECRPWRSRCRRWKPSAIMWAIFQTFTLLGKAMNIPRRSQRTAWAFWKNAIMCAERELF